MNQIQEWHIAKEIEKEINSISITGEQMKNGWNLSPEAQQVYDIIKNNDFKMCLQAIWDEVQENNIYSLTWANVAIFIHDMIEFGILQST
jgi:hypothetical protein